MTTNVNALRGSKPNTIKASRIILYSVLVVAAFYYLLPLGRMVMTSLKDLDDVRQGNILRCRCVQASMLGSRRGTAPVPAFTVKA